MFLYLVAYWFLAFPSHVPQPFARARAAGLVG